MLSRLPRRCILPVVAGVLVMAACDDDDDDPIVPPQTETFSATLASLNGSTATGTATFSVTGDQVVASVDVNGADTGTVIRQHVHVGGTCPTIATADTNADGIIDGPEAVLVSGRILVPLDGDVTTQAGGAGSYPTSDSTGSYEYADTVSLTAMLADLTAADPDTSDLFEKITGNTIGIDARVVAAYGVADTVDLDSTVLALPGLTPQQSLPIACGPVN